MNKPKRTWKDIFRELPPDEDESHSYVRAWQSYTPSRREWMRRKRHPWWVEALAPWIVRGLMLLFIVLAYLLGWLYWA